jgi:hypothetical protein
MMPLGQLQQIRLFGILNLGSWSLFGLWILVLGIFMDFIGPIFL